MGSPSIYNAGPPGKSLQLIRPIILLSVLIAFCSLKMRAMSNEVESWDESLSDWYSRDTFTVWMDPGINDLAFYKAKNHLLFWGVGVKFGVI